MKSKKSMNAMTHGVYAREAVLPWEDAQVFAAFHAEIRDELNPSGILEEEAVREVVELHWRKQRLAMGFLLPYYKSPASPELFEAAKGGLSSLATHLAKGVARQPGVWTATTSQVMDYIKARKSSDPAVRASSPQLECVTLGPSVVEQAYDPAALERHLKAEVAIDNRIAKVMSRLVGLKEYKKMYAQPPVPSLPAAEAPPLSPAAAPRQVQEAVPPAATTARRKWGDPE